MSRISPEPYFHAMNGPLQQVNRPSERDFRAFQNWVNEGAPASLYNLTKSAPDPYTFSGENPQ